MFYVVFFIIGLIIAINIMYFLLPSLAPIPFFPTNQKDIQMIVNTLLKIFDAGGPTPLRQDFAGQAGGDALPVRSFSEGVKERQDPSQNQTIIDLGAGTGTVIFAAANAAYNHHLPTQFIAVEIHPLLVTMMYIRRFFHPNKKNIRIMRSDIFKLNYSKLLSSTLHPQTSTLHPLTIYIYVGLFVMDRLKKSFINLPAGTRVVSYMYAIPKWEKKLISETKGIQHDLYEYVTS